MSTPDIFLSYNREDQAAARHFAEGFEAQGLSVWWDVTLRSGEAYDQVTEEALRTAKAVVVLWSKKSVASRWVRAEATLAERNRTLVPARIQACDLPIMFELTQTAELSHWQGDADDPAWRAFVGDVRRLVGRNAADAPPAADRPASGAGAGIPTIAVLPFASRGGAADLEITCEDLTEEVTRQLARIGQFEVTAAGTMAAWRGKSIEYRVLGRELDVRYFVEAKLQRSGESIRLTAQVIDAASGGMPWSERFVRQASELEKSPETFATIIAAELHEAIFRIETKLAMTKSGRMTGWDHMIRANAYGLGLDSRSKTMEEYRCAVAAAPDWGLAHAWVAGGLAQGAITLGEDIDEAMAREIRAHAREAMRLDGDSCNVLQSLVLAYAVLDDADVALRLARRAVELGPWSPNSYLLLGFANEVAGRIADAIAAYEQQDRLLSHDATRKNALSNLGRCLCLEGRIAEAEEALDRSLTLEPDFHGTLKWKAIVAAQLGDEEAALAAVRRLRAAEPDMTIDRHVRQMMFYKRLAERLAEPVAILRRLWDETGGAA